MMVNRLLIGLAVAGSVAAGVALGVTGAVDVLADEPATVPLDGVSLRHCPGGDTVGELRRGDRVLLTGVDESGDWLELRSPYDSSERLWIRGDLAVPDETTDDLPVRDCGLDEYALTLADGEQVEVTTSTTAPDESTTTTTTPDGQTTTTQGPAATSSTTQGPGPTTPTTTPTTQPKPVIPPLAPSPGSIWERYPAGGYSCSKPSTSLIDVEIANATSATLSWNIGPHPRSKAMAKQGNYFSGVLGPFDEETVPFDNSTQVTVTVTAYGPGGSSVRSATVTLNDCTFG